MGTLSIVGISGNVRLPSRTSALVVEVLDALKERIPSETRMIDLAESGRPLLAALTAEGLDETGRALVHAVESADMLVIGTPVYRGSYTGVLKHLFDLVSQTAFIGKPVILTATGGSQLHGLVTEHQLRPLFGFFGAFTVPTTIYATEGDFSNYRVASEAVIKRVRRAVTEAASVIEASIPPAVAASPTATGLGSALRLAAANG